jgi:hypothetical protein
MHATHPNTCRSFTVAAPHLAAAPSITCQSFVALHSLFHPGGPLSAECVRFFYIYLVHPCNAVSHICRCSRLRFSEFLWWRALTRCITVAAMSACGSWRRTSFVSCMHATYRNTCTRSSSPTSGHTARLTCQYFVALHSLFHPGGPLCRVCSFRVMCVVLDS